MTPRRVSMLMLLIAVLLAGCGSSAGSRTSSAAGNATTQSTTASTATHTSGQPASTKLGAEGMPLESGPPLAPASSTTPGTAVDGIQCAPVEQLAYHIHAHVQVYVDGAPRALPAAIGLLGPVAQQTPYGPFYGAQRCYYWLHTHASDGVIHIESPTARIYTLGNFFNEWRQPLSASRVASAGGKVTAYLNGKRWTKNPTAIPLVRHAAIQLDVGSPAPAPQPVSWAGTSL